jgi:eukaryotic-like serine/threonine-protein kinase
VPASPSNLGNLENAAARPETYCAIELASHLAEQMNRRWRSGERPLAEELWALHPEILEHPEAALELVAEELYLRQESGEVLDETRIKGRFPQWRRQVGALLDCHQALAPILAAPRFPEAGQTMGEFSLLSEIGRGTQGRVFLATQPALSDRPVVLKFGHGSGAEHLSLARLQHSYIVPLYSVHEFPGRGLRALCLPYFGGATLADLLQALRDLPHRQRDGRDLLQVLRQAGAASPLPVPAVGPACDFLARASYVQAVCRLGVCLADALAYAAERGLLHLDLKPSNVLLAADGQPMLLDFHLARAPIPADALAPPWLGGTPGYMPPEQQAALSAVRDGLVIETAVDGRADIYALGLVLYEMLGGPVPPPRRDPAAVLRKSNPNVSASLAALLAKCLEADPARRYATTSALAEDLRRHLADLPLCGVANRNMPERWRKWRRRRPLSLPFLALLVASAVAGGFVLDRAERQIENARSAMRAGEEHLQQRQFSEAVEIFRRGIELAEGLPFCADLNNQLRERLDHAECGQAAGELHRLCEQIRPLYGSESLSKQQTRTVLSHCRALWDRRQLIARRLGSRHGADLTEQVCSDLLDLAILGADLRVRLSAPDELRPAREEALALLDEAEILFGPSCVLSEERRAHALAMGRPDVDGSTEKGAAQAPRNGWEHFAVGRSYLRAGNIDAAEKEMDLALALEPGALWPNFWKGSCAFRCGRFDDAVVAFSVCIVLSPRSAWCYSNRGLAYAELGRVDRARQDYDRALELDPTLAVAVRGRGLLHYRARRYSEARADFRRAIELGAEPAASYADLALVYFTSGDKPEALACIRHALDHDPGQAQARELLARINSGN